MSLISRIFNRKSSVAVSICSPYQSFSGSPYSNAAFRSAVDCIGRHVAKLEAHSDDENLQTLLSQAPNRYMTGYDLLYRTATSLYSNNNAFLWLERENGKIRAVYPLTPQSLELHADSVGNLFLEMFFSDGKSAAFAYSDLLHLRRHYLTYEVLGDGNEPLTALLDTAETLNQGIGASVRNGTAIRGLLKFTSLVNADTVKAEQERFVRDYFNPTNSGGIAAVDQRFDFQPIKSEPYAVPQETVDSVNLQICSYLGISPNIVSGAFSETEFSAFYESIVEPFAVQLSQEIRLKTGKTVIFSPERLEFSSADTRIKLLRYAAPMGVLSVNEARKLLSLPPVPDGDARLQSLNYVDTGIAKIYQIQKESDTDGSENQQSDNIEADDTDRLSCSVRSACECRRKNRDYQTQRSRWGKSRRGYPGHQPRWSRRAAGTKPEDLETDSLRARP